MSRVLCTADTPDGSKFVDEYVKKHKQELDELRTQASRQGFEGTWVIIGDRGYLERRLQYATTSFPEPEVSPRIILSPKNEADIRKAIALCREMKMALALRTGGHQYCGYSSTPPTNMQLDLSQTFRDYRYDAATNVLRCGVSHGLGDWALQNHQNGIYLPMGVCAHVNLGGHVHTGGWGMVARSHGLLADHVLAFDIILASGQEERIVRPVPGTTSRHNDDVFFAVLGGSKGGDFGIVTHWEFSPLRDADYPNSACYSFMWFWSRDKMQRVVEHLEKLTALCASGEIPSDYEFMLSITGFGFMKVFSNSSIKFLRELENYLDGVPVPPMIQMWMCYTNKGGGSDAFDDQWFESFTAGDVCGEPLLPTRLKNTPISKGLAEDYIMMHDREMQYPFVKRSRATMAIPDGFSEIYAQRMDEIMGELGTKDSQHLVSQMQIYAGGAVSENGKSGSTSYAWRDLAFGMSHDAFYSNGWFGEDGHQKAEAWQQQNDRVFIGQKAFADRDMRMFAYTFGDRVLDNVWPCYYDSQAIYDRLRKIKGALDPDGLLMADAFSVKPL